MTGDLYYHDFEDAVAGTHAPTEPSPTVHPSMQAPRIIRVVGSPWQAVEHYDGRWSFTCNGEVVWGPMTGNVDDAFRLLLDVHRDPSPVGASPEPACDPLAPARGILLALLLSAPLWAAAAYMTLRWRGVL